MNPKKRVFPDGEAEGILDYGAVPDMLGIRSVPDSTILAPEIMAQLQTDLSSIGKKATSYMPFEVETLSQAGRYFGAQLQFVSSLIESIYQKNPALYNRMIMHSTTQMLLNKDVFVGFMLFQFYLLRKAIVRDNENEEKIMKTNNPDDIDISAIQDQLRRNACIFLFVKNDGFSTAFPVQDFTQNLFPVAPKPHPRPQIFGVLPEKIARISVPEYADAEDRHGAFARHVDTLFPPGRKHDAALLTHIGGDLLPQDPIELLVYLGDTVIFEYPESKKSEVLIVKLDRNPGVREMHAFKTLLAATDLACYSAIINTLIRAEFDYLWVKFLQESPSLLKKLGYPQSPESRLFRILFTENRLKEIITNAKSVEIKVREKIKIDKKLPPAPLIKTQLSDEAHKIPTPAMNFTIDQTTGVVMPPHGWKIPDGCRLVGDFWYLENVQKKPLSLPDNHFEQKSLKDILFFDEGGQEFYGKICFKVTLTTPQGSIFSSATSSISSPELSFIKLRNIEAPSMKFTIDENTGIVKVPEGWILPEGCIISWKVEYRSKELSQSKDFVIRNGILDISYKEGEQEVYDKKIYVVVTLTAPNGSTFPTGTSITSSELSFYRKAPEAQTTVPDAPQNVTAKTASFGEIIVSFDAPGSNGGSPIMSYTVTASNGQKVTGANSPIAMKGLPGGKMYTFTVTAKNHKGESNHSTVSMPTVATLEAPTFKDTQAAWAIALGNPSDGLWYSLDEDNNIIVTLDDSLVGDGNNTALDNLVYRTITIDPHGVFDIGDVLGEELSASLRVYAGQIRQEIIEKEERKIERDKQNTIYHTLQDELHPCMEVLRGLAGTELATEKLNGATLSQTFREKGVPMTNTIVRKKEKPAYKDILTLNFTERDVTATYCDGVVTFSGQGYTQGSEGIQRAYHDFREVITELGKFLFLTESQKSKRLQKLRAQRQALVGSFINNLKSPKKTVNAQLIAVSDAMLVPSYMGDSVAHAGFPPDGSPDVRYVVVTGETLEAEYEKLRISIHGSGDAVKNKSISIMCLVRTGHIHINGDTGGDNKKPYNVETVAANIESLRNSPQGRALLWDRIIATYGGTGTKIINGALKVLEEVKSIYDNILPTDEDTREEFIDDYLDELCREGILISYVRFSAVTIKEVREGLKAQE